MALFHVISVIVAFTLTGVAARRVGLLRPESAGQLNRLALGVTLPAGIFRSLHTFTLDRTAARPPLFAAGLVFLLTGLSWALARRLRLARPVAAVFVLAVIFSNTAFMGFPVVSALYGDPGLTQAVLLDQLGMEPLAFTLGAVIAAGAVEGASIPWADELWKLVRFPPLITLAAAITWRLLDFPHVPANVDTVLHWISAATVPIVMVSLGLVLRIDALRRAWRLATLVVVLRLVLSPLLAWGASRMLGSDPLQSTVTTLELGMPTMMFTLMLAIRYRLDVELSAALVTATLAGSMVTLPAWVAVLR